MEGFHVSEPAQLSNAEARALANAILASRTATAEMRAAARSILEQADILERLEGKS